MPISCTFYDLTQVMSYYSILPDNKVIKDAELVDIRILFESYKFYQDINFYIIMYESAIIDFILKLENI